METIGRNVADVVQPARAKSAKEYGKQLSHWTPEQLRAFLAHVKTDRLYAAWRLISATGMRRGEVLGLRWADIDLGVGRVTVAHTRVMVNYSVRTSRPKTDSGARSFLLDAGTVAALRAWRATQAQERLAIGPGYTDSGYVFTMPDGAPVHPQRFSDWFQQHLRRAGLPRIRLHDVRHSYATAGLAADVDLKVLSERLGHATTQITADLYQHVPASVDQAAAEAIAAAIDG